MNTTAFSTSLRAHPNFHLQFILPQGGSIPAHAHITEVGRVDKTFVDCGGTKRETSFACLQAWVADDLEHRITAGKLADIMERAESLFCGRDLNIEVEYEGVSISQFPVLSITTQENIFIITLGTKHTDCLAQDICLTPLEEGSDCRIGSTCC